MYRFERAVLLERREHAFREARLVRFQDVDAAGIIFFVRVLEYFHDAYVSFLERAGHPLHIVLADRRWAAPLRHAEADYLSPLRFGDGVEVALAVAHIEASEVTLGWRLEKLPDQRLAAIGQTVHTFVDPATFERVGIPSELRAAWQPFSAEP
jgi:1,4-dihydroxy-2-naphthoyl-CoA hydrolase